MTQRISLFSKKRSRKANDAAARPHPKKTLQRLIEDRLYQKVSYREYREKVRDVYDGPQGAMLATCSLLSLHAPLGERLTQIADAGFVGSSTSAGPGESWTWAAGPGRSPGTFSSTPTPRRRSPVSTCRAKCFAAPGSDSRAVGPATWSPT